MQEKQKKLVEFSLWPDERALVWLAADRIASKYLESATWISPLDPARKLDSETMIKATTGIDPRPVPYRIDGTELAFGLERYDIAFRWRHRIGDKQTQLGSAVTGVVRITLFKQDGKYGIIEVVAHSDCNFPGWEDDPNKRINLAELDVLSKAENWGLPVWMNEIQGELSFIEYGDGPSGYIRHNNDALRDGEHIAECWPFKGTEQYIAAQKAAKAFESVSRSRSHLAKCDRAHTELRGDAPTN